MKAMFQSDSLFITCSVVYRLSILPLLDVMRTRKKTLCALVEDSKAKVTFKQCKKKAFMCKIHETYFNKSESFLKLSSPSHLPPDS